MTEFAHKFSSNYAHTHAIIDDDAKFTLVLLKGDSVYVVDSNDVMAYETESNAIDAAMSAVTGYDDICDLYNFGEYYGTAKYVDMTPESWFSRMQVVFSMPYC